jgi:hypothetical protein
MRSKALLYAGLRLKFKVELKARWTVLLLEAKQKGTFLLKKEVGVYPM